MNQKNFLTLRDKVAELFILRASGSRFDCQRKYPKWELSNTELLNFLEIGIGGVIFFGGTIFELQNKCKLIQDHSNKSLLLCADVEEGVGQRFEGATTLIPPFGVAQIYKKSREKGLDFAEKYGECIGEQAKQAGLNWVLAPVCDVNTNIKNPVINMRAWGDDAEMASLLIEAFQKGLHSKGVLSCAKHFPGHGDTSIDSHLDLPVLHHDFSRLNRIEFIPFRASINAGVSSVMTGHLLLPNFDKNMPASLSFNVINNLLREHLSFQGLVVTDALVMNAITNRYGSGEAAIMAFAAGADLILMPNDPMEAIDALTNALLEERVSMQRLEESLDRRNAALQTLCTYQAKSKVHSNLLFTQEINCLKSNHLSKQMLHHSVEFLNRKSVVNTNDCINLISIDNIFAINLLDHSSPAVIMPEDLGMKTNIHHNKSVESWFNYHKEPIEIQRLSNRTIFIQIFTRGNPFVGDKFNKKKWLFAINQLQENNLLKGIAIYGSYYLWLEIKQILNDSIPAGYSPGQMPSAQREVLLNLLPVFNLETRSKNIKEFTN